MYDYAVEVHLATINPAAMVATRYIGKAGKRTRHLTPSEIREYRRLFTEATCADNSSLPAHYSFALCAQSNVADARWKEINFETGE
jgi:hypothetical protein